MDQVNLVLNNVSKYQYERSEEFVLCGNELVSTWYDVIKPNTRTVYTDIAYPYKMMTEEEFKNYRGRAFQFMREISCGNPELLTVIWECIGCMLAPSKTFGKIFIFYGTGNNGKSLLLKLVGQIMGQLMTYGNILAINDKFALEPVMRGICNVTDDVGITTLKETGLIKSLIDGSKVEVNRKYKGSVWWEPSSQFVICCNELPKINDTTNGMIRRLAFIPFELHLKEEQVDRTLFQKMKADPENLRYIMSGGILAFRQAFQRGRLTKLAKQEELVQDFIEENQDPIKTYYDLKVSEKGGEPGLARWLDGKTTEDVFNDYKTWMESIGYRPDTPKSFTRQFGKYLPTYVKKKVISLGGVKFYCYTIEGKLPPSLQEQLKM